MSQWYCRRCVSLKVGEEGVFYVRRESEGYSLIVFSSLYMFTDSILVKRCFHCRTGFLVYHVGTLANLIRPGNLCTVLTVRSI